MNEPDRRAEDVLRLLDIVARLRGPGGCPWDREQTIETLKPFAVEETYELLDAIDSGDAAAHREELGDLLLQIVLQAQIRAEGGEFGFGDVARDLADKLVRRHPHVFGDATAADTRDVLRNWEAIKSREKEAGRSSLDGVPRSLPALLQAEAIQKRAARVGFDWREVRDVLLKVREETAEVEKALASGDAAALGGELGDLLFAVVNLCRFLGVGAEDSLRRTTAKFVRRFHAVEGHFAALGRRLSDCTLEEMDAVWESVKRAEREAGDGGRGEGAETARTRAGA